MVALATFLWVQEPYEIGVTGLKTSESKSEGFGSSYGVPRDTGEGDCWNFPKGIFPACFLPSLPVLH